VTAVGDRVRILIALPELGVGPGALGTVRWVFWLDDAEMVIDVDGIGQVTFYEDEFPFIEAVK